MMIFYRTLFRELIERGKYRLCLKLLAQKSILENEATEFIALIEDLMESEVVIELESFTHHLGTTRLQHCLNVSYYNYLLCKKLKLDCRAAARAGLLHDLFFYNRKERIRGDGEKKHSAHHPRLALETAQKYFDLDMREEDIIVKHMWPMTRPLPKYKETFVIVLVDKYCCILELSKHFFTKYISSRRPLQRVAKVFRY